MSKKRKVDLNNPITLIQVILMGAIRLTAIIIGWILNVLLLAVKHWIAALIIIAAIFITLYTFGVL